MMKLAGDGRTSRDPPQAGPICCRFLDLGDPPWGSDPLLKDVAPTCAQVLALAHPGEPWGKMGFQ